MAFFQLYVLVDGNFVLVKELVKLSSMIAPAQRISHNTKVLDHSAAFNVIPKRYIGQGLSPLDVYFAMGRGRQADGVDVPASEMKKW